MNYAKCRKSLFMRRLWGIIWGFYFRLCSKSKAGMFNNEHLNPAVIQ